MGPSPVCRPGVDRYFRPEVPGSETCSSTSAATGRVPACTARSPRATMPTSCWLRLRTGRRRIWYCSITQGADVRAGLVLEPIDHVEGHDVAYVRHPRIAARCHGPHRDIAVRQHADHALAITDGGGADIAMAHLLS